MAFFMPNGYELVPLESDIISDPITFDDAMDVLDAVPPFLANAGTKMEIGSKLGTPVVWASVEIARCDFEPEQRHRVRQLSASLEEIPGGQLMKARLSEYSIDPLATSYKQIHQERQQERRSLSSNKIFEAYRLAVMDGEILSAQKSVLHHGVDTEQMLSEVTVNPNADEALDEIMTTSRTRTEVEMSRSDCNNLLTTFDAAVAWMGRRNHIRQKVNS